MREKMENKETLPQWPVQYLTLVYLASFILASLLPSMDGRNGLRLGMYAMLSVVFWVRVYGAVRRKETGYWYLPYAIMMIVGQFLIDPLMDWILRQYWIVDL
jgi:hypothetical protein